VANLIILRGQNCTGIADGETYRSSQGLIRADQGAGGTRSIKRVSSREQSGNFPLAFSSPGFTSDERRSSKEQNDQIHATQGNIVHRVAVCEACATRT
jgi:hypothetical protein